MTILELAIKNIPPRFRLLERFKALVKVLVAPSTYLQNNLNSFQDSISYQLIFNSQVIYLERRLNDACDPTLRRIYIDDTLDAQVIRTVVFRKTDQQPSSVIFRKTDSAGTSRMQFWRKGELESTADFVVFIPGTLNTSANQILIKNIVNFYKVAGRRFVIQTF